MIDDDPIANEIPDRKSNKEKNRELKKEGEADEWFKKVPELFI